MNRKYKKAQKVAYKAVLNAIESGVTSNAKLKEVLMDVYQDRTFRELAFSCASNELRAAKQWCRAGGYIEITKGNEPILIEQLTEDDVKFIDGRRATHIAGELETRVEFNQRHGRPKQAEEAASQLALFSQEEPAATPVEPEMQAIVQE